LRNIGEKNDRPVTKPIPNHRQHRCGRDPQRDSIFTKGPADVLDHATSEIAMGTKLGIDATHKLAGEGFKRPWPPLIRISEEVRRKIDALFGNP
jgi:4-hydroxy-3-polyprenylbenzoate decarboxylase